MESLTDELFRKLEERKTARPVLQHPPVAQPDDRGNKPSIQHENVRRNNRAQGRRGTAERRPGPGGHDSKGSVGDGNPSEGRDNSQHGNIPKCKSQGKRERPQNTRSRSQISRPVSDGRDNILYPGNSSRNQNHRGRNMGQHGSQNDRSHSEIRANNSRVNNHDEGSYNFQRDNRRNFNAHTHENSGKHGNTDDDNPKVRRPMGYRRLQELSNQSSAEVTMVLANSHSGFLELVQSPMRPDLIILVMKVLANACQYEMGYNKGSILSTVCHSNFVEEIRQYLFRMLTDKSEHRKSKIEDFIDNLLMFYETVMKILPNTASEKFEDLFKVTDVVMNGVENYQKKNLTKQKEMFLKLEKQLANMIEERNSGGKKMKSRDELLKYQRPPDDFREKNVFPTKEDIFDATPFVRPNIVDGAYEDVEHYLDVQFRLMREDFVAPLREGIAQFVHQTDSKKHEKKRIDNVRMYHKVVFGDRKVINDQVGLSVHFDPDKRLMNTKWEYSKRFMFGALLCFSKNNFQDILFGTVLEREIKALQKGQVTVLLCNEAEGERMDLTDPFVMAESETYFEPYQLVLKALQRMTEETFPMYRYIIAVEKERYPPLYLQNHPHATYGINERIVQVLNGNSWPGEEALQLDTSQYEAFRAALTEEFVVIQGPPGTGKTFLGLKIAASLIKNSRVWNTRRTPILVVCYTNHALDQFLEGLLPISDNILRIGGQSKGEKLAKYNLKERRKHFHLGSATAALRRDLYNMLLILMTRIKTQQANIEELEKMKGVLRLEDLEKANIISDNHLRCFTSQERQDLMTEWLGEALYEIDIDTVDTAEATDAAVAAAGRNDEEPADLEDEDEDQIGRFRESLFDSCDVQPTLSYRIDVRKLGSEVAALELQVQLYSVEEEMSLKNQNELLELIQACEQKKLEAKYWKSCLQKSPRLDPGHIRILEATRNLWQLSPEDRWILYKNWVKMYKTYLTNEMQAIELEYRSVQKRFEEAKQAVELEVMQSSLVVGMTTTMAARMQPLLQALKPKIVIVEEAAEVLESHIVVSLTRECEHLILIGDHQQLRPSTSVYRLAVQFHFDVSLFERMVKNGIRHHRLGVQHRMRPEVARLIVPTIYPELLNHPSVQKYPQVKGVTKSVFFVSHSAKEEEVQDIMSHQNRHEAEFILHLCRYLLQQGYQPDEITILTTYKGQMFLMKRRRKSMASLNDVKITVVDNFQGEENKIILLSLVRSNDDAKIGFLKIENRVCVALSRAKEGLYIVGNMNNLTESSSIWPKVKRSLEEQGCFGTELTLQCSVHLHRQTKVRTGIDFAKFVPEGGCSLLCNGLLECGHYCQSICHANNRHHKEYRCHENCERTPPECPLGHPCLKKCYQYCGQCVTIVERTLPCGHVKKLPCHIDHLEYNCQVMLEVRMPHCEHLLEKPCFKDIDTVSCPVKCEDRLPCGHSCLRLCHPLVDPDHLEYKCMKPCARKNAGCSQNHICAKLCHEECGTCQFEVKKKLPCGHVHQVKCSTDPAAVVCGRECKGTLPCGHKCPQKCSQKCGGCRKLVPKKIPECGHTLMVECSKMPSHSKCRKRCEKTLKCGHDCVAPCGLPCTAECHAMIASPVRPVCGHAVEIACFMSASVTPTSEALLGACQAPCGKVLACNHQCLGTCGECLQGRIHASCKEKCERSLICGHKCSEPCAAACPPCKRKCLYRCQHSKCPKKCGEPCDPCKEPCDWRCEHCWCTKLCHEMCDRNPCYKPCKEKLKCGHDCIGFCGDPCPPLCRSCNRDEVTEVFFGTEDEEDARFVLLVDCQHTLESTGLEHWLAQDEQEVSVKTCPKCKSNILNTLRFMNHVKTAFKDVQEVKRKIFGPRYAIENEIKKLHMDINKLRRDIIETLQDQPFGLWRRMLHECVNSLNPVRNNRRNNLNLAAVECLKVQVHILSDLGTSMKKVYSKLVLESIKQKVTEHFNLLLNVLECRTRISIQETEDFNRECQRFLRMTQLAAMRCVGSFEAAITKADIKQLYDDTQKEISCIEIYSEDRDKRVKICLDQLSKAGFSEPLSEAERKAIVRAIGLPKGHWFKCPNGHYYAIADCGGAMQVAKCLECGEQIGGTNHHLLSTNRFAGEMDGATRHAWPGGLH